MTPELVIQIFRQALMTTFWLSAPLLVIGFIAGIRDQPGPDRDVDAGQRRSAPFRGWSRSWPRLLLLLPWMLKRLMTYTARILGDLGRYAR